MTMSYSVKLSAMSQPRSNCIAFTHVVLHSKGFDKGHDLETGRRVQTACRLVEKENFGGRDKLARDACTTLLATTDTLSNGRSNQGFGLVLDSERFQQGLDTVQTLVFRNSSMRRDLG